MTGREGWNLATLYLRRKWSVQLTSNRRTCWSTHLLFETYPELKFSLVTFYEYINKYCIILTYKHRLLSTLVYYSRSCGSTKSNASLVFFLFGFCNMWSTPLDLSFFVKDSKRTWRFYDSSKAVSCRVNTICRFITVTICFIISSVKFSVKCTIGSPLE